MKILFSGCSFTMGAEVEKTERFSRLVCDAFDAEEYNIAYGGRSNVMSAILTITEAEKIKPDYIVFGVTFPKRSLAPYDPSYSYDDMGKGDDDMAYWNDDGEFQDQADRIFQIWPVMNNPEVPRSAEIQSWVPVFRNDIVAHAEMMGMIKILEDYSNTKGIPLCMFQSAIFDDIPTHLNGTDLAGTPLEFPPKSKKWLQLEYPYSKMARMIDDLMPETHPGPETNRRMADILVQRIKEDLE